MDRISFISGLSDHNGEVLREYIHNNYEIVHCIYDFISGCKDSIVSVVNSDDNTMTIKFTFSNSDAYIDQIKSYLEAMSGIRVCQVGIKINILETNNTYIIAKFNTML